MDEIRERLRRLYTAVGDTIEPNLTRVPPVVIETGQTTFFMQDFSGDLSLVWTDSW